MMLVIAENDHNGEQEVREACLVGPLLVYVAQALGIQPHLICDVYHCLPYGQYIPKNYGLGKWKIVASFTSWNIKILSYKYGGAVEDH